MENTIKFESEPILNYLHSFSCFEELLQKSSNIYREISKETDYNFESLKSDFDNENSDIETNFILQRNLRTVTNDKATKQKLKKVKSFLGLDLNNEKSDEETIFNNF